MRKTQATKEAFTSNNNLIQADKPSLLLLMRLKESSSSPIAANTRVAIAAPDTSIEEKPTMNSATIIPIGMKNSPPIVGVPFLKECLEGPSFLMNDSIFNLRSNGTPM